MERVAEQNRRSFDRFPVQMAVSYRINDRASRQWREGEALNLSAGGVLLRAPRPRAMDLDSLLAEQIKIALELPLPRRVMMVTARLAWSDDVRGTDECRMGLRFLDLDTADQEYLWRWVREQLNA